MREASGRLEAMERMGAEATRIHAVATHRLAAAIEVVGERMREFMTIIRSPPRTRVGFQKQTS